ncbi:MAG: hypothetical protein PHU34_09355 [Candidatus Methanoperedens sp.]|nr:hypothetical protein [Candidatus Methanoperedens sp.]
MENKKIRTKEEKQHAKALEIAERVAKETGILQKKALEKLNNIKHNELSQTDSLQLIAEGIQLERRNYQTIIRLEKRLEQLQNVDINKLSPVGKLRFLMDATKLESQSRGAGRACAHLD